MYFSARTCNVTCQALTKTSSYCKEARRETHHCMRWWNAMSLRCRRRTGPCWSSTPQCPCHGTPATHRETRTHASKKRAFLRLERAGWPTQQKVPSLKFLCLKYFSVFGNYHRSTENISMNHTITIWREKQIIWYKFEKTHRLYSRMSKSFQNMRKTFRHL